MDNLYYSIIILVLSAAVFVWSWLLMRKERYVLAVILLIAGGFLLRFYTASDGYLHKWDERYHALVAKNMTSHPLTPTLYDQPVLPADYKSWVGSHIWLHKQPLPLWAMAGSMSLFGFNETAVRLPSIILTTMGIWLTFAIAVFFFSRRTAWMAAFLYAINGLIIEISAGRIATDHIDVFFLFFVSLAVYFSIRFVQKQQIIYNILTGIAIGAAILCKWLPALIVLPVWFLLVKDSDTLRTGKMILHLAVISATATLVFLPWQIYIYRTFPLEASWEASFNMKHITEALEGQTGPFYYFLDKIRINYGEHIYIPLGWFLWVTFRRPFDLKNLALLIWFGIPFLFFSAITTKMQGYILFTAPVLFMITGECWFRIRDFSRQHRYKWLMFVLLLAFIALPVRYSIERIKPFATSERYPAWTQELKALGQVPLTNGVLLNYSRPVEAMFYTSLTAYDYIPETKVIEELVAQGYTVLINEGANINPELRQVKGLVFVCLSSPG